MARRAKRRQARMVGGVVMLATMLAIILLLLDLFIVRIPEASFPPTSESCLTAFNSRTLMIVLRAAGGVPAMGAPMPKSVCDCGDN
jgi:hypothetical protein